MLAQILERGKPRCSPVLIELLHEGEHAFGVKPAIGQVDLLPRRDFKLTVALRRIHVDACAPQTLNAVGALARVHEGQDPLAGVQTFPEEGEEHLVLLLGTAVKGTHVTGTS